MYDIKNKTKETKNEVTKIFKNVIDEVLAVSLVIVAAHSLWSAKTETTVTWLTWVLGAAASIIAVYAAYQLVQHYKK